MDTPEKKPPSSTESSSESTSGDRMSLNPNPNHEIPPPSPPLPSNPKDTDSASSDQKSPSPNDLPPSTSPPNAKPSTKNAKPTGKSSASGKPPKSEKPAKKPTNKSVSSYKSKLDDTVYQILFRTEFPALANAKKACLEDVVRYTKIHGKVERRLDSMEDKAIEGLQSEWKQRSDEFIGQEYPGFLKFAKPLQSSYTADVGTGTKATRPKRSNRKEDFRDLELDAETEQKSSKRKRPESQANEKGKKKSKKASAKEPPNENEERELSKKEISEINRRERQYNSTLDGVWRDLVRKDIPKAHRLYVVGTSVKVSNGRKTATLAAKEAKKWQLKTNKQVKDFQIKGRRAMREMMSYWKRSEKEERDSKKKAEKVALDSARKQEEEREAMRQSRKLNFLITQTELYSHFVGSKTGQPSDEQSLKTDPNTLDFDAEDDSAIRAAAEANAQQAVAQARSKTSQFDEGKNLEDDGFQNPASLGDQVLGQPKLLSCTLKEYQLKGLTWLANLYEQGINGILADEMGLGKTVQSISVMAYLAEVHDIWGPFLVVAPASTLHNWQQEIAKFVPEFKVLPYWGSAKDRKVLRKFWDRKQLRYTKNSPFHVLVTSYQIIVADSQYFNRIKWQYMILDEAQAIKSSSSSRWKSLLNLQCRNRLLLTGTPIQNSMQELWALLHFIMPTLFDSHEEFSDWFSKDIESHATKNKELNEAQLKRLHMILKPFMLRRVKKHVQQELGDKIEIDVYCNLTPRQKMLYKLVKSQISIKDLIDRGASGEDQASLMNLVMQFRKVCNHPDLFDRQEVLSAFSFAQFGNTSDWLREPPVMNVEASAQNPIKFHLPKIFSSDSGLLDMPSMNSTNTIRESIYRKLSVITDPTNEYMTSISKFSGTPAGKIVKAAQQGLLERALDNDNYDLINDQANVHSVPCLQIVNNSKTGAEYAGLESVYDEYLLSHYIKEQEPAYFARVTAPPISMYASEKFFFQTQQRINEVPFGLYPLTLNDEWNRYQKNLPMTPGRLPVVKDSGYTTISVPSMTKFIADSGKLKKLDELLAQLKKDDHRVLVYFQMTKMMDLMEEYLSYRQYKYLRLDGSSKLNDRRDLVNDWQTRPELFVFLLSTRAGGLGINLTAADTVVFFDSDWNPTIDSQAMDRAHRLGQTRQVTVYRLLVRGTIEERMRNRAKQKEQVQAVVMEGSKAAKKNTKESSINNDVAYWLLDDDNDGELPSTN